MSTPRTTCAVAGCTKPVTQVPWSALCNRHAHINHRHGNPLAKALTLREMRRHQERVARTIAAYLNSSAVKAALIVAADLLNYRPRHDFGWENETQKHMQRLASQGVTPRELLVRVCSVWALQAFDARFNDGKELDYALARAVLRLRSAGQRFRPGGKLLKYLGREIREQLGKFCVGLCKRVEQDDQRRAAAQQAFSNGWHLEGETAD